MDDIYQRTSIVLGEKNIDKLKKSHIVICGIGGVGSYTVEALARIGILHITLIDKDDVDITNINRQIIALSSTIGMPKVEACKSRILDINKNIIVRTIKENITKENIEKLFCLSKIDYIVDAIDNVDAKIEIIKYCVDKNIKCISSMGMANKINPLDIKVADIYKTMMCPLAKIVRNRLKEEGIKKQKVVYSIEKPSLNNSKVLGSVSFVPSVCGLVIASEVVKDIIQ